TQELALKTLKKVDQKNEWVNEIVKQRKKMESELLTLAITEKVYPSDANFLLVKVKEAFATYQHLMNIGIIVRDRSRVALCAGCLRITIGTPQENDRLINELKKL
ncbi:MAG: histidinol-phosphate transaminase, partial [Marivirga sp.]|nr:histidinol-phosphate transaminase [Marivirga sp.]